MTEQPDLAAATAAQQQIWSDGDFSMVATIVYNASREPRRGARDRPRRARPRRRLRQRQRRDRRRAAHLGRHRRRRLRPGPARARSRTGGSRAARGRVRRGRRPGPALRGRQLRRRDVDLRRDVRPRPGADRGGAAAGGQAGRPDRDGATGPPTAAVGTMFRTIAKHTGGPPPGHRAAGALGHRGAPARAVRRRHHRAADRAPRLAPAVPLRRPLPRVLPHLLRPDQDRLRTGRPGGRSGAGPPTCAPTSRRPTPQASGRWCSNRSTCRSSRSAPRRAAVSGALGAGRARRTGRRAPCSRSRRSAARRRRSGRRRRRPGRARRR